jgi:hypothetical protein
MQTVTKSKSIKQITKEDFINALRSGQYEQLTDGRMGDGKAVCANGVWEIINGFPTFDAPVNNTNVLGMSVQVFNRIAELNDSKHGFHIIADILEQFCSDDLQELNY